MSFLPDIDPIIDSLEPAYQEFLKAENLEDTRINKYGFYYQARKQIEESDEIPSLMKSLLVIRLTSMLTTWAIRVNLNLPDPTE